MDVRDAERCAQLERELERFRRCLAQSPAILAVCNRQLRYVWIYDPNPRFRPEAFLGKTDVEVLDSPGTRALLELKRRVLESGQPRTEELELALCGEPRIYEVSVAPLRGRQQAVAGVRIVALDVTDRRRAIEQLEQSKEEQVLLVSHDLRQPLNAIGLAAELVKQVAEPGSALEATGERILASVRSMAQTLDDLLEVGTWKSTELSLHREPTALSVLARQMLERCFAAHDVARVVVDAPVEVELPVDRIKLSRALQNLVHNALKFSPRDAQVQLRVIRDAERVTIMVSDRGEGMDRETAARVFEKHSASQRSRDHGGRGLGLYAARLLVEAHGGCCRVTSEPGQGATFSIELPLG